MDLEKKIILFDGVCNLCNSAVAFLIKRDRRDVFRFAPLQTQRGTHLADHCGIATSELTSIALIDGNRCFTMSSAVLRIARELPRYRLLYPLVVIPKALRDGAYDFVARNRYRWFGRRESCMIPTPEVQSKFLS